MPRLVDAYIGWRYTPSTSSKPPAHGSLHDDVSAPPQEDPRLSGPSTQGSRCSSPAGPQGDASTGSPAPASPSNPLNAPPASTGVTGECRRLQHRSGTPLHYTLPSDTAPNTSQTFSFDIDVFDILSTSSQASISSDSALSVAEALVSNGYLGSTPVTPSLAISLHTLELLRRIRLFKASFSLEAFAKLVCYYYSVPYQRTVRNAISDSFDIYLAILRAVRKRVMGALGRESPDWRVCNACPACCYKLEGEPAQSFSRLFCMDGNNSLKRMRPLGGRKVGDDRVFTDSDYYLPQGFVDAYANEVHSKAKQADPRPSSPHVMEPDMSEPRDPTDGDPAVTTCTKNWKAAQSDDKKRSWDVFEETGVFVSACRHGLILWIIDMVRSGELARYPLATIAKALDVFEHCTMCGYDVGCSFLAMIQRSSLGKRFNDAGCRMCVNAFHGYSHEYSCQVQHHPNCIEGMGLEDLETMERIFSASNQLAPVIRYASAYRRRVLIDAFYQQWDEEKYLNLGKMLFDNYRQALGIIREQGIVVAEAMKSLGLTPEDLVKFAVEERAYLRSLGNESSQDLHQIAYVEGLEELRAISTQLARATRSFLAADGAPDLTFLPPHAGPTNYEDETSRTRKIETNRRYLDARRKVLMLEVADLEVHLGITASWQPGDAEYIRVAQYVATRKYQRALSNLQRLVVQRLFELHKMNISQTGYRMRRHIAKNMQTRSRALRNAIQTYNSAAAALDPPRPKLDWDTVSHYHLLQEFELLNDTRADVRDKPWAQPAVRETVRRARRVARAHEEIASVNLEAQRVHTSIHDEERMFARILEQLRSTNDIAYGAVLEYTTRRRAASAHVLTSLKKLYALEGFSGNPTPGRRMGTPPTPPFGGHGGAMREPRDIAMSEATGQSSGVDEAEEEDLEDDDVQGELTTLTDFYGTLSL
ncbi:hypothetical protein C2E23DRAFT_724520 [Lenzites betulinus]|nr:hypothetical protein C2E23DRAFT_724520 [Lenzites betulinus]